MRHLLPHLLILACCPAAVGQGLKAGLPGGRSSAAALVDQLGDPDFRTREAAGRKLLDLGERAVSALEAGRNSPVPEVARRCDDLLAAVRHTLDADAVLAPTLVELPDGETTVQKVFDSLTKQSGYQVQVEGDQAVLSERVKWSGGRVPFWDAVQAVCATTRLEVSGVDATPTPAGRDRPARTGSVRLAAASGVKRWCVHKAVLVQVAAPSRDELAFYSTTRCPLVVRAFPEPKVKWYRLTDAEVAKGVDAKGHPLGPAAPEPFRLNRYQEEELLSSALPRISATDVFDRLTRGALQLAVPPDGSAQVSRLSGVVRFSAWRESGELAVVRLTDGATEGTADGPHGTRLSVTVVGPIANEPGSTVLKVVHRWNPERVRVEQGGAAGDAVWFENVNGRIVPVKSDPRPADRGPRPNASGTVVTNAAGEQLTLTAGNTRFDAVSEGGRSYSTMSVEYVARRGTRTDGKPAVVAFHAARAVEVVMPFAVSDLPLEPGTGEAFDRPRSKR